MRLDCTHPPTLSHRTRLRMVECTSEDAEKRLRRKEQAAERKAKRAAEAGKTQWHRGTGLHAKKMRRQERGSEEGTEAEIKGSKEGELGEGGKEGRKEREKKERGKQGRRDRCPIIRCV